MLISDNISMLKHTLLYVAILASFTSCASAERWWNGGKTNQELNEARWAKEAAIQKRQDGSFAIGTTWEEFVAVWGLPSVVEELPEAVTVGHWRVNGHPMLMVFKSDQLWSYEVDKDQRRMDHERRIARQQEEANSAATAAAWGSAISGLKQSNQNSYQNNQIPTRKTTTANCQKNFDGSISCTGY